MSRPIFRVALKCLTPSELKRVATAIYREIERRKLLIMAPGVPRYRDPENQFRTWTGKGPKPKWVQEQLAKGRTMDELEI